MSVVSAAAYRGLLAEPALRRLAIADVFARLPQGMVSLTVLLVAAEHASMAVPGIEARPPEFSQVHHVPTPRLQGADGLP